MACVFCIKIVLVSTEHHDIWAWSRKKRLTLSKKPRPHVPCRSIRFMDCTPDVWAPKKAFSVTRICDSACDKFSGHCSFEDNQESLTMAQSVRNRFEAKRASSDFVMKRVFVKNPSCRAPFSWGLKWLTAVLSMSAF